MKGLFKKTEAGLIPCSDEGLKVFNRMAIGDISEVSHVRGQNLNNLNRFFQIANLTFNYQPDFNDLETWRKQLLILGGHYDEVKTVAPEWLEWILRNLEENLKTKHAEKIIDQLRNNYPVQKWAKSIALEKASDQEFKKFISGAVTGYSKYYAASGGMPDNKFLELLKFCK